MSSFDFHRPLSPVRSRTPFLFAFAVLAAGCAGGPAGPARIDSTASNSQSSAVAAAERLTESANRNPLLAPWTGPYGGVPPWDRATPAAFPEAFGEAILLAAEEVLVITTNPQPPSFANTIAALEDSGRHRDRVETLFAVLTGNLNTKDVQAIDREWSPKLAAASDAITFDRGLFARLSAVYAARENSGLTAEQKRLTELTFERFVKAGAKLSAADQAKLGKINQDLAVLFTDFSNKVLADENTWVVLESEADLAGLTESLRASSKAAATERGLAGKWIVVNTRSSVDPFLTFSARRDLREKVWRAFKNRGDNGNENDTNVTIAKIVKLRAERAALLGYASHADWRMVHTMATDPKRAEALMMRVWPAAVARVGEEVATMQEVADRERAGISIEPWDYLYYAEKVRKVKYDLDQNEVKAYFELDQMIRAAFFMAGELYGLDFVEMTGKIPVFHPEVRTFEVHQREDGRLLGIFYGDYFARTGKRSGAWASGYQGHETFTGKTRIPITSNNNNFVRGAPGDKVLISLDDARTLFHEFGHAIHGLVSEVAYPGLSSTPRDFVEFPSQVLEMWVLSRPILDRFGRHYKTGEPMPESLITKIEAASKFNQGYSTVEYLSSAIVDMAMHTLPDGVVDADRFERETLAKIGAPRQVAMRHRLPQFLHLFSSDSYSAGYYSYLWSEVMAADTVQAFRETGNLFDPATAAKMRKFILAPGNTTDRTEGYRQLRGRDPDVRALLEKKGFPVK